MTTYKQDFDYTHRPPLAARPLVRPALVITDQLILFTRSLRGGPIFTGSSTTPSMTRRVVYTGGKMLPPALSATDRTMPVHHRLRRCRSRVFDSCVKMPTLFASNGTRVAVHVSLRSISFGDFG
jgi:hypothetical protein